MNGFNKFQALTIVFICMFVFVIAAFYTNVKDAASKKTEINSEKVSQNQDYEQNSRINNPPSSANIDQQRLYQLIDDVQELRGKVDEFVSNSGNEEGKDRVSCSIEGVFNDGNVEQLTSETSLRDVKNTGKQLILFCSFNN